jgi:hypothetical protein
MVSGGVVTRKFRPTKVQVPTQKLVLAIVELYTNENEGLKKLAIELAASIIEGYENKDQFRMDVLGTYSTSNAIFAKVNTMKRAFPKETKILSEIFGAVLFGGDL